MNYFSGPKDWMFLSEEVPKKLKAIYDDGFKIIIFTNQRGMEKGHTTPAGFMTKIEDIITALDIPIQVSCKIINVVDTSFPNYWISDEW